jgi:hypothetical protein
MSIDEDRKAKAERDPPASWEPRSSSTGSMLKQTSGTASGNPGRSIAALPAASVKWSNGPPHRWRCGTGSTTGVSSSPGIRAPLAPRASSSRLGPGRVPQKRRHCRVASGPSTGVAALRASARSRPRRPALDARRFERNRVSPLRRGTHDAGPACESDPIAVDAPSRRWSETPLWPRRSR